MSEPWLVFLHGINDREDHLWLEPLQAGLAQAATALSVPLTRVGLALGQAAKLLNVEGYPVLSIDPATGGVALDELLLTEQYGVRR